MLWEGQRLLNEALIITNAYQQTFVGGTALYAEYNFTGNQEEQT